MALRQVTVPYRKGYDLGVGADLATGSPMNVVVTGEDSEVKGAGGPSRFRIVRAIGGQLSAS